MQRIAIWLIEGYRWIAAPFKATFGLSGCCRYYPSCSHYAQEAVRVHGVVGGAWLALKRIGRCHPWGGSGYDPVPGTGDGPVSAALKRSSS